MLLIITLTSGGKKTAELIKKNYKDTVIYSKPFDISFKDVVKEAFLKYDKILFIMATGIVVRTISDLLVHKSKDPAILVMDEKGKFVISLVSGHLGGANYLAEKISKILPGCLPVITTASDVNNLLSIDMLAKKYNLELKDFEGAKNVTAELVNNKNIYLISDLNIDEKKYITKLENSSAVLEITNKINSYNTDLPYVKLIKKDLVLGIGCKRNTDLKQIKDFVNDFLKENGYLLEAVSLISSAWVKSDEVGLINFAKTLAIEFKTYEKEEIQEVIKIFKQSDFVKKTIGVGAVSESCGYLASNYGKQVVKIKKNNGITLSLWEMKGK